MGSEALGGAAAPAMSTVAGGPPPNARPPSGPAPPRSSSGQDWDRASWPSPRSSSPRSGRGSGPLDWSTRWSESPPGWRWAARGRPDRIHNDPVDGNGRPARRFQLAAQCHPCVSCGQSRTNAVDRIHRSGGRPARTRHDEQVCRHILAATSVITERDGERQVIRRPLSLPSRTS